MARNTRECVYVLAAVYVTAENLLRIFPKGSKLKKNTNFTLAYDLTGLDRSSQSQSWMTEHSLCKPFPSSAIFSVLFSFSAVPFPHRWISWSGSGWFISVTESAGQQQASGQHRLFFFIHFTIKRHNRDVLLYVFFRRLKGITCVAPLLTWQNPGRGLPGDLLRTLIWNLFSVSLSSFITHTSHYSSYGID